MDFIKVVKFGGSSLANAKQFEKVKKIVLDDPTRRVVVVSAPGKRNKQDDKITNLLYLCYEYVRYSVSSFSPFKQIEDRYYEIKNQLNLQINLDAEFSTIKEKINDKSIDCEYLVSRGEYLCAKLMAEYLGYDFIDAKDIIFFNYDGKVDIEKTKQKVQDIFKIHNKIVVGGFYGSLPNGNIKLFSRGGSDITGSILAESLNVSMYENWTDVSGILVADPNVVKNPQKIEIITYNELKELSYMGANVLHPDAVAPAKRANIKINIRNTNEPENSGTIIVGENDELLKNHNRVITGISGKQNYSVISLYKEDLPKDSTIIKSILEIFIRYHLTIEHIISNIDNLSFVVSTDKIKQVQHSLIADIKTVNDSIEITIVDGISLIAIVGRNMINRVGTSGKIFKTFGENGVNIKIILQNTNEINIMVGVENKDFEKAINVIYNNL